MASSVSSAFATCPGSRASRLSIAERPTAPGSAEVNESARSAARPFFDPRSRSRRASPRGARPRPRSDKTAAARRFELRARLARALDHERPGDRCLPSPEYESRQRSQGRVPCAAGRSSDASTASTARSPGERGRVGGRVPHPRAGILEQAERGLQRPVGRRRRRGSSDRRPGRPGPRRSEPEPCERFGHVGGCGREVAERRPFERAGIGVLGGSVASRTARRSRSGPRPGRSPPRPRPPAMESGSATSGRSVSPPRRVWRRVPRRPGPRSDCVRVAQRAFERALRPARRRRRRATAPRAVAPGSFVLRRVEEGSRSVCASRSYARGTRATATSGNTSGRPRQGVDERACVRGGPAT